MKVTKFRNEGTEYEEWFCPNCNRWFAPWSYHIFGGKAETECTRCGEKLVTKTDEEIDQENREYEKQKQDEAGNRLSKRAYDNYVTGGWY
ncbi:hypothetical protein DS742_14480 [Lacrimispora amygdalina]|uniref:Uncharacterized protein n=1 Tax=Lacrimispora amygdalina TaxID=253257 RepID=A0A3E2NBF3_9FIRM|nr:hypothetical protein [Clostridium indicum]RFZ78316.1 hypothetical protein DS742_14480 [Clostridium indicum]